MTFENIVNDIVFIVYRFTSIVNSTYNMIVDNTLILVFVLVFALFVGLALLKRLIHI